MLRDYLVYGATSAVGLYGLLGDVLPATELTGIAQLVSSGGFAALVAYLLVYHIPRRDREVIEERAKDRATCETHQQKLMEYIKACEESHKLERQEHAAERLRFIEELASFREILRSHQRS